MNSYTVMRENFQANRWDHVAQVTAPKPGDAVKAAVANRADVFGTYVAIPDDEWAQFMEGRTRFAISAHIDVLEPTA